MTAQKAKELSLEVWRYLVEHPEIKLKSFLPDKILSKVRRCAFACPLCELFNTPVGCNGCPLKVCNKRGAFFYRWQKSRTEKTRKLYAQKIVKAIEAWKPEDSNDRRKENRH